MDVHYEPFSEDARADPYACYRALRASAPVHFAPEAEAFVVSRYDDVQFVLKHPELFSSDAMGGMLMGRKPSEGDPMQMGAMRILILMDPPRHGTLRSLLNRGFTPRRIGDLEVRVGEIVEEAMAKVRGAGELDIVRDVAVPIPVTIIAELLGVERHRIGDFRRWSDDIVQGVSGSSRGAEGEQTAFFRAMGEMRDYLGQIVIERQARPRDDLVSVLIERSEEEAALSLDEIVIFLVTLLIAGNETTTNLIGSAARLLLEHPDQLALVARDRTLVPALVEEVLRYEPPVQFLFRRATREVELAGTRIPANAAVMPVLASANRDERVFERAEEFDLTRQAPAAHLTFGFGAHFCLGASLARLEAHVILEALLDELPTLERVPDVDIEYMDSFMMRGPRSLALRRAA